MARLTPAELSRKVDELRGYTAETESDIWHYGGGTSAHEAGHSICIFALGGRVNRICVGPGQPDSKDVLSGVVYHGALKPFDNLIVCCAGEIAEAQHDNRPINFRGAPCAGDMQAAIEIIGFDFESSAQFPLAVARAKSILYENSAALASLTRRLKRPPFYLYGDDFEKLMERMNVKQL